MHDWCPALAQPAYLLARVKFLAGELGPAEHLLRDCIDRNSQSADAHLLLAQVFLNID